MQALPACVLSFPVCAMTDEASTLRPAANAALLALLTLPRPLSTPCRLPRSSPPLALAELLLQTHNRGVAPHHVAREVVARNAQLADLGGEGTRFTYGMCTWCTDVLQRQLQC